MGLSDNIPPDATFDVNPAVGWDWRLKNGMGLSFRIGAHHYEDPFDESVLIVG